MEIIDRNDLKNAETSAFVLPIAVRFHDVDAAGIVFFARFFEYAHLAYEAFLEEAGLGLPEVLRDGKWAAPIRHAEADYRAPVRYGDKLEVHLARALVAKTEMTLGWRIVREDGKLCATIQTVHTFVNPADFQRRAVPSQLRAAVSAVAIFVE